MERGFKTLRDRVGIRSQPQVVGRIKAEATRGGLDLKERGEVHQHFMGGTGKTEGETSSRSETEEI